MARLDDQGRLVESPLREAGGQPATRSFEKNQRYDNRNKQESGYSWKGEIQYIENQEQYKYSFSTPDTGIEY